MDPTENSAPTFHQAVMLHRGMVEVDTG